MKLDSDTSGLKDCYRDLIARFPRFGSWYKEGFSRYGSEGNLYNRFFNLENETDSAICLPRLSVIRVKEGKSAIENADENMLNEQVETALEKLVQLENLCCEINSKENIIYLLAHK